MQEIEEKPEKKDKKKKKKKKNKGIAAFMEDESEINAYNEEAEAKGEAKIPEKEKAVAPEVLKEVDVNGSVESPKPVENGFGPAAADSNEEAEDNDDDEEESMPNILIKEGEKVMKKSVSFDES